MAGRKRHSTEDIVRKSRRADELAAEGKSGEEIAADLKCRQPPCRIGAASTAAWPLMRPSSSRSYASRTVGSSACSPTLSWRRMGCGTSPREDSESPTAKSAAIDMLKDVKNISERMACTGVRLSRSAYRRVPVAHTPARPDAGLRAQLRTHARKHPRNGCGCAASGVVCGVETGWCPATGATVPRAGVSVWSGVRVGVSTLSGRVGVSGCAGGIGRGPGAPVSGRA